MDIESFPSESDNYSSQENFVKSWLTSAVFEYACKNNFVPVIDKILKDENLSSDLPAIFAKQDINERQKVKAVYLFTHILKQLLVSVETFSTEDMTNCYPWNSEALPVIIKLLERTYEQCDFISLKKFFSLLSQLKFLDLIHLLRLNVDSSTLMQKLNLHFPRWHPSQKASLQKQFSLENPKILDKVEESYSQCRRLILKLAMDSTYRSLYMKEQFFSDMKKMVSDSVGYLKEVIENLNSNAGLTVIEKSFANPGSVDSSDLGYQLMLDYLQPESTPEILLKFLDEIEPALQPPSGGFSSCLLPFDTFSECSDTAMDSESEFGALDSCSDESCDDKE